MENGETLQAGARRESMEEALAAVEIGSLLAVVHVLHARPGARDVPRAGCSTRDFGPGPESLEVRLCLRSEIPWYGDCLLSVDFALAAISRTACAAVDGHHSPSSIYRKRRGRQTLRLALSSALTNTPLASPPPWRVAVPFRSDPRPESTDDLCRHRKLHQVQVHGLRGSLPGRLLPRRPELPGHRPGRMHRLHALRARMPGGGHLLGRGAAGGPGALQAAERRAGQEVAGDHGEEGRPDGCQGMGRSHRESWPTSSAEPRANRVSGQRSWRHLRFLDSPGRDPAGAR